MGRICGDTAFQFWINTTTAQTILLQITGAIVNTLSLWCLWKCRRTGRAIKLQLGLVFTLLLLICTIILPGEVWINYLSFYCRDDKISDAATIFFLLSSGFTLQLARMNISSVAIYRFIAVKFPQLYKKLTQVKVVLVLEAVICAYMAVPYVMGFTQTVTVKRFDDGNQFVKFGESNTTIYKWIYKIYGYNFMIPFLITLVAYSLMAFTVLYQKYKSNTMGTKDHVTFTLQFLIFVDLLLDGPHAISHFIKAKRVTMTIFHMIFHLHLLADPLVFLLLNPHNRRILLELLHGVVPQRLAACLPPATASTNAHRKDSMQGMYSPTPQQRRKFQLDRQDSDKSHMTTTSNPAGSGRATTSEKGKPLLSISSNHKEEAPQHATENDELTHVPLTPVDDIQREF